MKIIFDNNQHTPHIDFITPVDGEEKIIAQISICKDGLLATGDLTSLIYLYPKTDNILLIETPKKIHQDWVK